MCITEVWTYRDCACRYDHQLPCATPTRNPSQVCAPPNPQPSSTTPMRTPSPSAPKLPSGTEVNRSPGNGRRVCENHSVCFRRFLEPICDDCLLNEMGFKRAREPLDPETVDIRPLEDFECEDLSEQEELILDSQVDIEIENVRAHEDVKSLYETKNHNTHTKGNDADLAETQHPSERYSSDSSFVTQPSKVRRIRPMSTARSGITSVSHHDADDEASISVATTVPKPTSATMHAGTASAFTSSTISVSSTNTSPPHPPKRRSLTPRLNSRRHGIDIGRAHLRVSSRWSSGEKRMMTNFRDALREKNQDRGGESAFSRFVKKNAQTRFSFGRAEVERKIETEAASEPLTESLMETKEVPAKPVARSVSVTDRFRSWKQRVLVGKEKINKGLKRSGTILGMLGQKSSKVARSKSFMDRRRGRGVQEERPMSRQELLRERFNLSRPELSSSLWVVDQSHEDVDFAGWRPVTRGKLNGSVPPEQSLFASNIVTPDIGQHLAEENEDSIPAAIASWEQHLEHDLNQSRTQSPPKASIQPTPSGSNCTEHINNPYTPGPLLHLSNLTLYLNTPNRTPRSSRVASPRYCGPPSPNTTPTPYPKGKLYFPHNACHWRRVLPDPPSDASVSCPMLRLETKGREKTGSGELDNGHPVDDFQVGYTGQRGGAGWRCFDEHDDEQSDNDNGDSDGQSEPEAGPDSDTVSLISMSTGSSRITAQTHNVQRENPRLPTFPSMNELGALIPEPLSRYKNEQQRWSLGAMPALSGMDERAFDINVGVVAKGSLILGARVQRGTQEWERERGWVRMIEGDAEGEGGEKEAVVIVRGVESGDFDGDGVAGVGTRVDVDSGRRNTMAV